MACRVPVGLAAEALFEGFSKYRPDLLGECRDRDSYRKYALSAYSIAYNDGASWVVCKTAEGDHKAELHVYAFDHRLSAEVGFFESVLADLKEQGKHRVSIPLMPGVGKTVRRVLLACGFALEGILEHYYRSANGEGYEDAEIWVRLL